MSFSEADIRYMNLALDEARAAAQAGEPPIGAVLVRPDGEVVRGHNRRQRDHDITAHAELIVLREAGRLQGDWRMSECTLYVTLEPCPMCAGAILAARVGRLVYGAKDAVAGALGSVLNLPRFPLGAHPTVEHGLLADESRELLQRFFKERRK